VRLSALAPLALSLPLAACRFDFDPVRAQPMDAAPEAPLSLLPCGAPPQFSTALPAAGSGAAAVTVSSLATAAFDTGYYLFATDSAGDVHGFSMSFDAGQLAPGIINVPVLSGATGPVAAVATPDGPLAAIEYGRPDPAGTRLIPLDAQLASRGATQMDAAWYSIDSAIAGTPDGALAFLGVQDSGAVAAKRVSSGGADLGASHLVIDASEKASLATVTAARSGYLVTWATNSPQINQVRAEIIDPQMSVSTPPTTINPNAMFDGADPRAAYAASADRFLFAWWIKTSTSDELWVSLRDGQLVEQHAIRLTTTGTQPRVVAGNDDFLVAWKDTSGNTTSGIAAARVRFDGTTSSLVVSGNGGKALAWDLATRAGQPALIWIESATMLNAWFDPLCN
jgi:hypothetical protein